MIIDLLLDLIVLVLGTVAGLLPDWEPVDFDAITGAIDGFMDSPVWNFLTWLNLYVPLVEAITVGLGFLGLYVGVVLYRMVVELLQWLHVLGGGGK